MRKKLHLKKAVLKNIFKYLVDSDLFGRLLYWDWSETCVQHTVKMFFVCKIVVVAQYYDTDVNKEYAIRGNSAILKCVVPSFVADFVKVLSWHTDQGEEFVPGDDFGIIWINRSMNSNQSPYIFASRKFRCYIFDKR